MEQINRYSIKLLVWYSYYGGEIVTHQPFRYIGFGEHHGGRSLRKCTAVEKSEKVRNHKCIQSWVILTSSE